VQLTETNPANAQAERDRFLGLALALKSHAESLSSISEALARRDPEQLARSEQLDVDVLRESLATHYGGMVVTCVVTTSSAGSSSPSSRSGPPPGARRVSTFRRAPSGRRGCLWPRASWLSRG
jgi:hypothetical protein